MSYAPLNTPLYAKPLLLVHRGNTSFAGLASKFAARFLGPAGDGGSKGFSKVTSTVDGLGSLMELVSANVRVASLRSSR